MSEDPIDSYSDMDWLHDLMEDYDLVPTDSIADLIEAIEDNETADESEAQGHA